MSSEPSGAAPQPHPSAPPALSADPTLRVVVVTWNSGGVLPGFLESLRTATTAPVEVVVADNDSTLAPLVAPPARLLATGGNLGYGAAANLGAQGAQAEFLLVANPDVAFAPGSLDELLAAAGRWPGAGVLGPAIVTSDGKLYPSARALPSLGRGVGHALFGWCWPSNPWTAAYRRERAEVTESTCGWLSGSCMLLRRRAFESVGGLDEDYFMFCEDMDLCERLTVSGWQAVYVPTAVITHRGGDSTRQVPAAMLRAHHASVYRYLSRHHPRLAPLLRVGLGVRYLLSRVIGGLGAGARPTRDAEVLGRRG